MTLTTAPRESRLRHDPSGMLDQVSQYVKGLRSQGDPIFIAPQKMVRCIQAEHLE